MDVEKKMMLEASEIGEPLIIGLVASGHPSSIGKLKRYLNKSELSVIYKRISYGHLFIVDEKQRNHE